MQKKILIMCAEMGTGGIASAFYSIIKVLYENKYEIDLLTCGEVELKFWDRIKNMVVLYKLPKISKLDRFKTLIKTRTLGLKIYSRLNRNVVNSKLQQKNDAYLCEFLPEWNQEYDYAIAVSEFLPTYYIAKKVKAKKKIAWLHPRWDLLNIELEHEVQFFEKLDKIVVVSEDCNNALKRLYPQFTDKICTIENILDCDWIKMQSTKKSGFIWKLQKNKIVSVCRLDNHSKRLDRIVMTAVLLKKRRVLFEWVIVGDGLDRRFIEKMIRQYNVEKEVILVGLQENPYSFIKESDIFVLTSQYEGMPIVVAEALILQKPMVLTNCIEWSDEIKEYSIIVSNDDVLVARELEEGIIRMLDSPLKVTYKYEETAFKKRLLNLF